jgi:hypothetical protein
MEDEEITNAIKAPETPRLARKVFDFLNENSNLTTKTNIGMGDVVDGLDRAKLLIVAPAYDIELSRYLPFVKLYENKMLEQ